MGTKNFYFLFISLLFFFPLFGQKIIRVQDSYDDFRIPGVKIIGENKSFLGNTNEQGELEIPNDQKNILLIAENYEMKQASVDNDVNIIYLDPTTIELASVEFGTDESEARKIIKTAIANQGINDIKNLKSYQFQSYSKFWANTNKDSIPYILNPINKEDSTHNEWRKVLEKSMLFLGERAMDHFYSSKYGEKNIVKASRISGTKTPIYEFIAMQPISFQFNQNTIDFFFRKFVNPISFEGLEKYKYRILEHTTFKGTKCVVIGFSPKTNNNKRTLKGSIYLTEDKKALVKFNGENASSKTIAELDMDWEKINDYWFPQQQKFLMDGGNFEFDANINDTIQSKDSIKQIKKEPIWINLFTNFKNIKTPVDLPKKLFAGYQNEIDFNGQSSGKWDEIMSNYRDSILTNEEKNTYVTLDSIGNKYKIDKKLKLMRILTSGGKYDIGKVDLDLTKIFGYNQYEGLRLGIGGNTNTKFSQNFGLNGYAAYGFKDEKLKFGLGTDFYINKPYSGKLFLSYTQDVAAAGRSNWILQSNITKMINGTFNNIYNDYFYSYKKSSIGYEQDIFENFTFNLSANYQSEKTRFNYKFDGTDQWNHWANASLALRWAPKDKYVRTPYGKVTIQNGISTFYLTLTQGINLFNADYTPTRIEFSYFDTYISKLGKTNFNMNFGLLYGETSIIHYFEAMGNAKNGKAFFEKFGLANISSFETMLPGEFFSSQFIGFNIRHIFGGFKVGKRVIVPEFIYRGIIGDAKNLELHENVNFKKLNHLYQETGIEFNRLLFGTLGIGAYYRIGAYSHDAFKDNFYTKLTFAFPF